jgi:hypothetical protein
MKMVSLILAWTLQFFQYSSNAIIEWICKLAKALKHFREIKISSIADKLLINIFVIVILVFYWTWLFIPTAYVLWYIMFIFKKYEQHKTG